MSIICWTKIKGPIFWGTSITSIVSHFRPSEIAGAQWCKGATPIFNIRETSKILTIPTPGLLIIKILIISIIEAVAWVIKYFSAASDWYLFFFNLIKGININMLISIIIQVVNQDFVETIIKVDNSVITINIK